MVSSGLEGQISYGTVPPAKGIKLTQAWYVRLWPDAGCPSAPFEFPWILGEGWAVAMSGCLDTGEKEG